MPPLNAHADVADVSRGDRGPWTDPEGGQGVRSPLKNHKTYRVSTNTGPDPRKNYQATKPVINVGPSSARQRNAI